MKIGIDMVDVKRIKKLILKPYFVRRFFTEYEINYCNRFKKREERYAARFAAKEAYIKCISRGKIPPMKSIEVRHSPKGEPELYVNGKKVKCSLSITHCGEYAVAVCIL